MTPDYHPILYQSLARLTRISPLWQGLLVSRIEACEGFIECLTLDDTEDTSVYLLQKTAEILHDLPAEADDTQLLDVLVRGFEGFYFRACADNECWDSLQESFATFHARHSYNSELSVTDVAVTDAASAAAWFRCALGGLK